MSKLVLFVIILAFIAFTGEALLSDAGYILITFQQTAVETSLLVFSILTTVGVLLVIGIIKLLARIFGIKTNLLRWQEHRNRKRAQQKINQGMIRLLQEDWASAKNILQSAAKHQEYTLISLLALADAGQRTGDLKTRDSSFDQLEKQLGQDAELAIGLARADSYKTTGQWREAQEILEHIRKDHPKHAGIIRRLLENYCAQKAWASLEGIINVAKKYKVLDSEALTGFERQSFVGNFSAAIEAANHRVMLARANPKAESAETATSDIEIELENNLIAQWTNSSSTLKQNEDDILQIVDELTASDFEETAKALLEKSLKHKLSQELIKRYGQLNCRQPERLIAFLEKGLGKTPHSAEYLFALGRLYARSGDMAKAHPLLEKSIQSKQTPLTYRCLADIYDQLQQHERSSQCYRKAFAMG
jgi:HemY protein